MTGEGQAGKAVLAGRYGTNLRWIVIWPVRVLNLPRKVNVVPGRPSGHEQGRAARAREVGAVSGGGAGLDLGHDSGTQEGDSADVSWQQGPLLDPEHARVQQLGLPDVLDDRVT